MDQFSLKELLNFLPVAVTIAEDAKCQTITTNVAMARVMGTFYDDKIQPNASFLSSPLYKMCKDGKVLAVDELPLRRAVLRGEEVRDVHLQLMRPDGTVASIIAYAHPWRRDGKITGGIAAFIDVTGLRQAKAEVKLLRHQLEDLMNISEVAPN